MSAIAIEGYEGTTQAARRLRLSAKHLRTLRRCDCCSILLERSGDALHPNDRPGAGRCWFCKERYGTGPVGPEVNGDWMRADEREG